MNRLEKYGVWRQQASCQNFPLDTMFPENKKEIADAKKICLPCPVKEICLETAMENREQFGIWGGTTHKERKKLRRRRQRESQLKILGE